MRGRSSDKRDKQSKTALEKVGGEASRAQETIGFERGGRERMVEEVCRRGWKCRLSLRTEGWEVEFLTGDDLCFLCRLEVRCLLKIGMEVQQN